MASDKARAFVKLVSKVLHLRRGRYYSMLVTDYGVTVGGWSGLLKPVGEPRAPTDASFGPETLFISASFAM